MNVPTALAVAAYKFVSQHKDEVIDGMKDALNTVVDVVAETVDKVL